MLCKCQKAHDDIGTQKAILCTHWTQQQQQEQQEQQQQLQTWDMRHETSTTAASWLNNFNKLRLHTASWAAKPVSLGAEKAYGWFSITHTTRVHCQTFMTSVRPLSASLYQRATTSRVVIVAICQGNRVDDHWQRPFEQAVVAEGHTQWLSNVNNPTEKSRRGLILLRGKCNLFLIRISSNLFKQKHIWK